MLFGDLFEWLHLVHAGVVDEHVETAKSLDRGVDDGAGVGRLRDVAFDRNRLASGGFDRFDDLARPFLLDA